MSFRDSDSGDLPILFPDPPEGWQDEVINSKVVLIRPGVEDFPRWFLDQLPENQTPLFSAIIIPEQIEIEGMRTIRFAVGYRNNHGLTILINAKDDIVKSIEEAVSLSDSLEQLFLESSNPEDLNLIYDPADHSWIKKTAQAEPKPPKKWGEYYTEE